MLFFKAHSYKGEKWPANQGLSTAKIRHGRTVCSHPFCLRRAYLPRTLPEVTSEAEYVSRYRYMYMPAAL